MDEPVLQLLLGLGALFLGGGMPLVAFAWWVWRQPANGREWLRRPRRRDPYAADFRLWIGLALGLTLLLMWGFNAITEAAAVLW